MSTNGNFMRYNVGSGQFNTPTLQNLVYPKLQKKSKRRGEGEGEGRVERGRGRGERGRQNKKGSDWNRSPFALHVSGEAQLVFACDRSDNTIKVAMLKDHNASSLVFNPLVTYSSPPAAIYYGTYLSIPIFLHLPPSSSIFPLPPSPLPPSPFFFFSFFLFFFLQTQSPRWYMLSIMRESTQM